MTDPAPTGPIQPWSRALAVASLLGLFGLATTAIVAPIADRLGEYGARAQLARATLARYERLASHRAGLARWLERAAVERPFAGLLLAGASEAQAAALLQERLKRVAAAAGARLISFETLPPGEAAEGRRVGLRVLMTVDTASLQKVLYGLEAGLPAVVIDNLYVRARSGKAVGAGRHLDVRFQVAGVMEGEV